MSKSELMTSKEVAEYLKLNVRTVAQLAATGRLPAMKLGGRWRFKRAFLEQWLEKGLLDGFTYEMDVIETHEDSPDRTVKDLIPPDGIILPLKGKDGHAIVEELVQVGVANEFVTSGPLIAEAVMDRENTISTALPSGIALPHPRFRMHRILREPFISVGIAPEGIDFGAPSQALTKIFFLLCVRTDALHLRALARVSHMAQSPEFIESLLMCQEPESVLQCIAKEEDRLFGE